MSMHRPIAATQRVAGRRAAFTLVEMLVAMAITLVMMAAVVTLFANVSGSVRNRRATIEMSGQLRHVRNMLQQDLQGATCPGLTWQRPESNHGYIELIEGPYREGNPSILTDADPDASPPRNWPPTALNPEIDHETSILPSSNLPFTSGPAKSRWATDGGGLGDYDDILMLTVRNEHEPFVGRMPTNIRDRTRSFPFDVSDATPEWGYETLESPLAEVVWFAVENPAEVENVNNFYGEPGMRTIYRRTLLIAPWINPYRYVHPQTGEIIDTFQERGGETFKAKPGLVRLLPEGISLDMAIASIIAFQDQYDLSVRLEWDHNIQRWKIMANTLGDLTKRENRFGHFGFFQGPSNTTSRNFPYAFVSIGSGYQGDNVDVVLDPDVRMMPAPPTPIDDAEITANLGPMDSVLSYTIDEPGNGYRARPFVYVADQSNTVATASAMLNDEGQVVRVTHGPAPLWGTRRGEDVMMTDVLGFDLRVYDPGAPLFQETTTNTVLEPSDYGWRGTPAAVGAYLHSDNMEVDGSGAIGTNATQFPFVGQGAYVDMGYGYDERWRPPLDPPLFPQPRYASAFSSSIPAWFFIPRALSDVFGNQLAPGYAVYDTWSFHYENNGVNEDNDEVEGGAWQLLDGDANGIPSIDEGTNGLDDFGHYSDGTFVRLGVDDVGERETAPPYDKPLRGVQLIMRAYERDSRAIRQMRVNQHFMPE